MDERSHSLKSCPLCKSPSGFDDMGGGRKSIRCSKCKLRYGDAFGYNGTDDEMIAAWNTRADDDIQQGILCRIYGTEIEFNKTVPKSEIVDVCKDIWKHASKYSDYKDNSESAYYKFSKFLWVKMPDGIDLRLADIACGDVVMRIEED